MNWQRIIQGFGWEGWSDFLSSLNPSLKYSGMSMLTVLVGSLSSYVLRVFGLDAFAFICLLLVFGLELFSGLWAAIKQKETIQSYKLSRFLFKVTYYVALIAITQLMYHNYSHTGPAVAASVFHYMHVFVVIHIVLENIVSISENLAVINGKEKSHWIKALQVKINKMLK